MTGHIGKRDADVRVVQCMFAQQVYSSLGDTVQVQTVFVAELFHFITAIKSEEKKN